MNKRSPIGHQTIASELRRPESLVRIPPSQDVPLSKRVRKVLDSAPMRRLGSISQLGMVALVYPGATHSRLEHSLGVYHNAIRLLDRFEDEGFLADADRDAFLLASLLHDAGHWPYCHPIEDMRLTNLPEHEDRLTEIIATSELASLIDSDWSCSIDQVIELLQPPLATNDSSATTFLTSCMSGPIDVDKLDYLQRDSLHAGVPYGQNFDAGRLISSMCRHPETGKLAIDAKGRTAAEMMVFARYVMFSEVYWHHAVRSATAMLQRGIFLLQHRIDLESSLRLTDHEWIAMLRRTAEGSVAETMIEGLFGARRRLYKRVCEFSAIDEQAVTHATLARRPYWWLVACAEELAKLITEATKIPTHAEDVLIDAPPVKLEVDIDIDVVQRDGAIRSLGEVSPVASVLAHQQFDNHVKRVRIFVRDDLRDSLTSKLDVEDWTRLVGLAVDQVRGQLA